MYNGNDASVKWLSNLTTKYLRCIQVRKNSTQEQQLNCCCTVKYIGGHRNLNNTFTIEDKDKTHFIAITKSMLTRTLHQPHTRRTDIVNNINLTKKITY